MRNLKKILALVLALIMSLSLMATAGAGSFQDVTDDNPYKTAIDVLDELKVFQGFEDGTFKPTDTLTRAQAAVLVYRIATGDVENKYLDNYTYMQQSKFTDLDGYNWAKGYINYCQNAGIVVGTDATHFNPGGQVTGYQLLVMLLRTLGYGKAGEFTDPKGWELQTASIAEREGILKNVTGGDFEHAAPRQMVAEILFRGILHDTVEYSPLTPGGYTNSGVSLGKKTLNLDDIEGVVVANRIADLYDDEPMADGQTRMIVDGKDYVIDMDTDATAIGLNHHAYVQNGKVLGGSLEADGNVIGEPEHGEAAKVADLAKAAGIKTNADTDYYVNFDEVVSDTSNYRLEYLIGFEDMTEAQAYSLVSRNNGSAWIDTDGDYKFDRDTEKGFYYDKNGDLILANGAVYNGTTPENFLYDKVIPAKSFITAADDRYMEEIFVWSDNKGGNTTSDDLFFGEVYVGTKSTLDEDDISDELSYDEFLDKYINVNENRTISGSDNGEWLRVIDNDGDGEVDYVLRTDFIMTTVVDYEKRTELYNVEYDVDEDHKVISKIPAGEIRKDEGVDMSVGAVILYTYIDGYYYVSNPEVKTLKVDTKSIEQKKNTFTADDEPYTWSGIDKEAERYYTDISQISYDVSYDMYFDHFGFVRLATEARRNFVLLTDGYFKTDLRDHEWKVELYNGEEQIETADVVDAARNDSDWAGRRDEGYDDKIDGFIDTFEGDHQGNRGTWKRLNTFGEFYQQINGETGAPAKTHRHYTDKADTDRYDYTDGVYTNGNNSYYADPFHTNIALASETDGVWTLQDVTNIDSEYNSLYRDYKVYELAGTDEAYKDSDSRIKQRTLKAKSTDLWGITGNNVGVGLRDNGWDNNTITGLQAIQTNGSTLYYYVDGDGKVTSWVGYQNLPEGLANFAPARAYAVTHEILDSDVKYEIADVVVFEDVYTAPVYDPQLVTTGINTKREWALGKDSEGEYTEHGVTFELFDRDELLGKNGSPDEQGLWAPQLRFYDDGDLIEGEYAKYGIYAGEVIVADETKHNDYVEIGATDINGKRISFHSDDVAAYEINLLTRYGDQAAHNLDVEVNDNILRGDKLIVVMADDVVKMVVNVSASGINGEPWANRRTGVENDNNKIAKLATLWQDVNDEWTDETAGLLEVEVTVKKSGTPVDDAAAVVTGLTTVDGKQYVKNNAKELKLGIAVDGKYEVSSATVTGNGRLYDIGGGEYMLTEIDADAGKVKLEITVVDAEYGIAMAEGSTETNVQVNGENIAADTVAKPGTQVTVKFDVTANTVPSAVTVTGVTPNPVPENVSGNTYQIKFTMPKEAVTITVTTSSSFEIALSDSSSGVTAASPTSYTPGENLGDHDITLTLADGTKQEITKENVTIKMGSDVVPASYYDVDSATSKIEWKAIADDVLVTGDIEITAKATDKVRTITLTVKNDAVTPEIEGYTAEEDGSYIVSQNDDVTLLLTLDSNAAQNNGILVWDGTNELTYKAVGLTGKVAVTIDADADDAEITIYELVAVEFGVVDCAVGAVTSKVTNEAVTADGDVYLLPNSGAVTVTGTTAKTSTCTASDGDAGTATGSISTGTFTIDITIGGAATWTITCA